MPQNRKYSIYEAADILQQAAVLHLVTKHTDYGTGEKYTSVEVHTLSYIICNYGITVTDLARDIGKTKSAISQMVKKLEGKGLIYRESDPTNDRKVILYATEAGIELHKMHKKYDTEVFGRSYKALIEMLSESEVNDAWTVLNEWVQIRRRFN
ncbi:MAG: MarR family winged helix-turn-helix transcriptional regulator [Oscillospiraceae bacterium]